MFFVLALDLGSLVLRSVDRIEHVGISPHKHFNLMGGFHDDCLSAAKPPITTAAKIVNYSSCIIFLSWERPTPARLLRLLLLMAVIESNPGPSSWRCTVCTSVIRRKQCSVRYYGCLKRCHLRCSGVAHPNDWDSDYRASCCPTITTAVSRATSSTTPPSHAVLTRSTSAFGHSATIPTHAAPSTPTPFRVMQFNVNGLTGKMLELVHFLMQNDIMVAAVQESKLNAKSRLCRCPGFTIIRKDRERDRSGGLAFLVRDTVQFRSLDIPPSPTTLEQQAIAIQSGDGELAIVNIYIPPVSSSTTGYVPSLNHLQYLRECLSLSLRAKLSSHNDNTTLHSPPWFTILRREGCATDVKVKVQSLYTKFPSYVLWSFLHALLKKKLKNTH